MSQKNWCKSGQTLQVSVLMRIKLDQQSHQPQALCQASLFFLSSLWVWGNF